MKLLPLPGHRLLLLCVAASATPALSETSFIPWSYTGPDLFPSAIVSSASVDWNGTEQKAEDQRTGRDPDPNGYNLPLYGDENGWLGVELRDVAKGSEVEVTVAVDGILKSAHWKGVLKKATPGGRVRVQPKAAWDYPALMKVRQQRPVNVVFNVTVNGSPLPEKIATYQLKSMNDCVLQVYSDSKKKECDVLSSLFAGYVNEKHPVLDKILKDALALRTVEAFTGYQGSEEDVYRQVFAIWNVLQRYGIKYSDVAATMPSKLVFAQTVRFLDQTLDGAQANCVDGSVLMASILTHVGIEAHLVLVPGHCFLEFALDGPDGKKMVGLETTKLGDASLTPIGALGQLTRAEFDAECEASIRTCREALETGTETLKRQASFFAAKNPAYMIIPIKAAREFGIMPLAFESSP